MTHFPSNNDEKNQNLSGEAEPKDGVTRRRFMSLFGGGVASLAVTACGGGGGAGDAPQSSVQLAMLTVGRLKTPTPPPTTTTPPPSPPPPSPPTTPEPPPPQQQPATGLPAWVPPVGYFADVPMKNNPADLTPSIYVGASAPMDGPFTTWGGSAILQDYSPLGAQVYRSGGHESATGQVNVQLTLVCDFSSLTWSVVNVPNQAHPNTDFGSTGRASDGTTYNSHTYDGLQEFPAAWGGGPKGSMIQFFFAGAGYGQYANTAIALDVSKPNNGYSQLGGFMPLSANGNGSSYPTTAMDRKRQGWWVAAWSLTVDYMLFVSKDGSVTKYPSVNGNMADGCIVLCDSLDIIVAVNGGYDAGQYASSSYKTLNIRDNATGNITTVQTTGPVPSHTTGYAYDGSTNYHMPDAMGLQWVDELGCIVGLDTTVSPPNIVKLKPGANPKTDPWTWSVVPVQHWTTGDPSGASTLSAGVNGIWSKFRWVPSLHAFVYCTDKNRKPQIVRIA